MKIIILLEKLILFVSIKSSLTNCLLILIKAGEILKEIVMDKATKMMGHNCCCNNYFERLLEKIKKMPNGALEILRNENFGISLSENETFDEYVEELIGYYPPNKLSQLVEKDELISRCKESREIWELTLVPERITSSIYVVAPTLELASKKMLEIIEKSIYGHYGSIIVG